LWKSSIAILTPELACLWRPAVNIQSLAGSDPANQALFTQVHCTTASARLQADDRVRPYFNASQACVPADRGGKMIKPERDSDENLSASQQIDARIAALGDWRGETLGKVRELIRQVDPQVVEEWKWRGVPVWSHDGIICTGETYKNVVKLTFAKGAALDDPAGMFNSSLEGNTRRAIDIHEGDPIHAEAFMALVRATVALNTSKAKKPASGDTRP
jgi:hypothetical protein